MPINAITLTPSADGILLPVKAQPGARPNGVVGVHGGSLKVAVSAVAEKGKANAALTDAIAEAFLLKPSQVTLARGATNPQKVFRLEGVTLEAVRSRLAQLLADAGR